MSEIVDRLLEKVSDLSTKDAVLVLCQAYVDHCRMMMNKEFGSDSYYVTGERGEDMESKELIWRTLAAVLDEKTKG